MTRETEQKLVPLEPTEAMQNEGVNVASDEFGWVDEGQVSAIYRAMLAAAPSPDTGKMGGVHPDDLAVDRFAEAMKAKLAQKRDEGRGGWDDKEDCSAQFLSDLLRGHVEKGDPLDVGNFAMMLHQRGEGISPSDPFATERMRSALRAFLQWGQQQCPCENDLPDPCPLCDASVANLEGCKAVDKKFPPRLLAQARAALGEA